MILFLFLYRVAPWLFFRNTFYLLFHSQLWPLELRAEWQDPAAKLHLELALKQLFAQGTGAWPIAGLSLVKALLLHPPSLACRRFLFQLQGPPESLPSPSRAIRPGNGTDTRPFTSLISFSPTPLV